MKLSTYIATHAPMSVFDTQDVNECLRELEYSWELHHDHLGRMTKIQIGHIVLIKVPGLLSKHWKISLIVPDGFGDTNQPLLFESGNLEEALDEFIRILKEREL